MYVFSVTLRNPAIPFGPPASEVSSSAGLLSLLAFVEETVFFLVVAFFLDAHGSNIRHVYVVRKVGLEPTCDQLPFLQGISLRGYLRLCVSSLVCFFSVAISTTHFALTNLFFDCIDTKRPMHHVGYISSLFTFYVIKL